MSANGSCPSLPPRATLTDSDWPSHVFTFAHTCQEWIPANQIIFQLGNFLIVLANLNFGPDRYKPLISRILVCGGVSCLSIWGWLILCQLETFVWNLIVALLNAWIIVGIIRDLRNGKSIDLADGIDNPAVDLHENQPDVQMCPSIQEMDQLFTHLSDTLQEQTGNKRVKESKSNLQSKLKFHDIIRRLRQADPKVIHLAGGLKYAVQNVTQMDRLSFLCSGQMFAHQDTISLSKKLSANTFVDAEDWLCGQQMCSLTLTTLTNSVLLVFDADKLRHVLSEDSSLRLAFILSMANQLALQTIADHKDVHNSLTNSVAINMNGLNKSHSPVTSI